jgi:thiosulfate dehydrogenase
MPSRFRWFFYGVILTTVVIFGGAYGYLTSGATSMATSAPPILLEETFARVALEASYRGSRDLQSLLPLDNENLVAGARLFKSHCGGCHGLPGRPSTAWANAMFPHPPQLFEKDGMVTDDPQGITYWKVTHGIRLSGMPAFDKALSETERWQVTMLIAHADKLSPQVHSVLNR